MRKRDDSKKSAIVEYINEYYSDYGQTPTVRAISEGTGIAVATVHRYLLALKESGELDYNGRNSITTERIYREAIHHAAPVLDTLPAVKDKRKWKKSSSTFVCPSHSSARENSSF